MKDITYTSLSTENKKLLIEAERALSQAYNPYGTQTKVGAAVRTKSGKIIIGSSLANASSTVNLCAERVAIATANSLGYRDLEALAVIGTDIDGLIEKPVMPCGVCRQFMEEFITINGGDIEIICSNSTKDKIVQTSLKKLLPLPYSGSNNS